MSTDEDTKIPESKPLSHSELMMHPVRFRVLMALSGRELTTRQIAEALPDISRASVYRHVHALHEGGLIYVTKELLNRATVEKVYTPVTGRATLVPEPERTPDDYLRYFGVFTQSFVDQFRVYVKQPGARPIEDGVSHWDEAVFLSSAERDALVAEIQAAVSRHKRNQPSPERVRFHVARILIPESPRTAVPTPADGTKGMDRP
ncbi:MAG: helix-turn-helix domain-containing protein [Akkermansiaceae bacterium]|nr:helix-turn-helix domain-containing protein [Armatimonadota bacterium]